MTSNNQILSIYNSRVNITDIMDSLKYDVSDSRSFSINEIDTMYKNAQMDMLLTQIDSGKKAYVKYYLAAKQLRKPNLDDIIEDLFVIENVLNKNDTLIIITEDEPNDTIQTRIKYLYDHDGIFVIIHCIKRLQYNILKHNLVPQCTILQDSEVDTLKKTYNISSLSQLPEISRFDPQALAMCLRPGEVCMFMRTSITAMNTQYYRVCI